MLKVRMKMVNWDGIVYGFGNLVGFLFNLMMIWN